MSVQTFEGFPVETLKFLRQLKRNNDREWFNENKSRYESSIREPALAFITAMQKPMEGLSACVSVVPKRVGGSLMRIYRDTRFSSDKTPYKTNIGIHFRHIADKDVHAPGFYVHIEPKEIFLGAGIWHPDSAALQAIRQRIDEDPGGWKRARDSKSFSGLYKLSGDSLKRPPRGYSSDHPLIEDIRRKDFIGVHALDAKSIEASEFVRNTTAAFKSAMPFMKFLCAALNLPL